MKKNLVVKIIIIVLAVLLVGAGIFFGLFYKRLFPKVPPIESNVKDTDVVQIINKGNYVDLLSVYDGYVLMDAGVNNDDLMEKLNGLSVKPEDVKYIFVTHSDADHVAALNSFPNATIYMWENEKKMLDGTTTKNGAQLALPEGITNDNITWVTDGQIVDAGGYKVECIGTPGHTLGSMSYVFDGKYIFTGDAFTFSGRTMSVHPYSMDNDMAQQTIDKLEPIINKCQMAFTGHYGYKKGESLHN